MTQLISNLLGDVRMLIRQEIALARAEFREELGRIVMSLALLAAAAGALALAGLWILVGVTRAIAAIFHWPLAGVFAGIGIALGLIGLVLLAIVWRQLRTLKMLPKTRDALRAQAQIVKERAA
jgi:membrane-bound ClpP family serine protease